MGFWIPVRRDDPEIMDRSGNSAADLEPALEDIRRVNRYLGGSRALLRMLQPYFQRDRPRPLRILDVGTGAADLPIQIVQSARLAGIPVEIVGVDRDPVTVSIARRWTSEYPEIQIVEADAAELPFDSAEFDVVTVSLFLHHFTLEEGARLLGSFRLLARDAVLVNDLRRHRIAWLTILVLSFLTGRAPMFRHDAPLSVLRAFTPSELRRVAQTAGATEARIHRFWPYRIGAELRS